VNAIVSPTSHVNDDAGEPISTSGGSPAMIVTLSTAVTSPSLTRSRTT
jgi:hypothetical protein